jgi:hypothetical protein
LVNISNLKLGNPQELGGETVITASCTATTFRFRKAAEMAPPPAPAKPAEKPPEKGGDKEKKKDDLGDLAKPEKGKK